MPKITPKIHTRYIRPGPRLGAGPGCRRLAAAWDLYISCIFCIYFVYIFVNFVCIKITIKWPLLSHASIVMAYPTYSYHFIAWYIYLFNVNSIIQFTTCTLRCIEYDSNFDLAPIDCREKRIK